MALRDCTDILRVERSDQHALSRYPFSVLGKSQKQLVRLSEVLALSPTGAVDTVTARHYERDLDLRQRCARAGVDAMLCDFRKLDVIVAPSLTRGQRDAAARFIASISEPAFEIAVIDAGRLEGMRPGTARDTFHRSLAAVVEIQSRGECPTNKALAQAGAPMDNLARLVTSDLSPLPSTQLRAALDDHIVEVPERILVESRTERTTGPDKFGVMHLQKPPGMGDSQSLGAPNTEGGISSAVALADCGDAFMPCGQVQIHQGWWHPDTWKGHEPRAIELALRDRARFYNQPFVRTPCDVASELLAHLDDVELLRDWDIRLDGTIVVGGRLSLGYPLRSCARYGLGGIERYLGTDLEAVTLFRAAGLDAFLELPHRSGALVDRRIRGDACSWAFEVDGSAMTLAELVRAARKPGGPWIDVPKEIVVAATGGRRRVRRLAVEAIHGETGPLPLQLIFMIEARAATELFVTTIEVAEDDASLERLVRLAALESARQRPGSAIEQSLQMLLRDGHLQSTPRRRFPERRGYSAVVATAFGVLQVVRRAA